MNLLQETIEALNDNGKSTQDVIWVGDKFGSISWDEFEQISSFEYDNDFGSEEINLDLVVVGGDWWLERYEYDGAESWVFQKHPGGKKEKSKVKVKAR